MSLRDPDTAIGTVAAGLGSAGITTQMLLDFGNLIALGLNIGLAMGGFVLLYYRIQNQRATKKDREKK